MQCIPAVYYRQQLEKLVCMYEHHLRLGSNTEYYHWLYLVLIRKGFITPRCSLNIHFCSLSHQNTLSSFSLIQSVCDFTHT